MLTRKPTIADMMSKEAHVDAIVAATLASQNCLRKTWKQIEIATMIAAQSGENAIGCIPVGGEAARSMIVSHRSGAID